jgi:hypothetical protein
MTRTTSGRTYDVENHLRSVQATRHSTGSGNRNSTSADPATTIGWGPNGHPANIAVTFGGTTTSETLHWDGDTILFVTDAAGNVTDFKVGLDGDVTPRNNTFNGLSVYDRDPAGVIVETSNSTGSTGFNPLDPSTITGAGAAGTTGYQSAMVPEQYVRGDGFMVAGVQINGVRAFDPNLGAWTTPDAYEGEVHDPVSQQRYMWNRGNAVDYSDPSGYYAVVGRPAGISGVVAVIRVAAAAIGTTALVGFGAVVAILSCPGSDVKRNAPDFKHEDTLPKGPAGEPAPSSDHPHSQPGTATGSHSGGPYKTAREWGNGGADGEGPTNDIHWTDHGRPGVPGHTIPHHHPRSGPAKSSERGGPVPGLPPQPGTR